ncbi:MAG: Hsp20/alpha crystallin family protein [Acidimicrobiia bacterium]
MAQSKEVARKEQASSHGLLDWLPRPGWLNAFEQALEATPMRIEERVDGDEFVVRAEMPGIDPDKDVEINVTDGMLQIRAERSEEKKSEKGETRRSEFHYGYFSRVISLPAGTSQADVKATYHDGILEVRLPLDHEKAKATKVPITRV